MLDKAQAAIALAEGATLANFDTIALAQSLLTAVELFIRLTLFALRWIPNPVAKVAAFAAQRALSVRLGALSANFGARQAANQATYRELVAANDAIYRLRAAGR